MPEGQGGGRKRKRAKPTSGATRHLLPEEGGRIHASPFPWKGLPSTARRGWLPFLRRLGALVYRRLETIPLALFHTARTLSGSLRSPPSPRGEGFVRRYSFSTYACIRSDVMGKAVFSYRSLPCMGNAIKLNGRTFLAPHRGSSPKG